MTQEQAQRIGQYLLDAGMDGQIYRIANGELVVRIKPEDYWLWSFDCWNAFCREQKKVRNKQRKAADRAQHGIDPQEQYRLVLFA